jgi:hypothetical protein
MGSEEYELMMLQHSTALATVMELLIVMSNKHRYDHDGDEHFP